MLLLPAAIAIDRGEGGLKPWTMRQTGVDSQGDPVMLELIWGVRLDGPWDLIQMVVKERGHYKGQEVRWLWVMKSPVWDCAAMPSSPIHCHCNHTSAVPELFPGGALISFSPAHSECSACKAMIDEAHAVEWRSYPILSEHYSWHTLLDDPRPMAHILTDVNMVLFNRAWIHHQWEEDFPLDKGLDLSPCSCPI
ncbi:hypothetical protein Q7C36_009929 [Tachysurus vachellii]|uniref:Uncharacterized protein n=1 Tax=Tachysurus vachellii TaxID=175792 RepID=A0AA88N1B1_TACVA|nr:hypothetical protein Q7C36_009929 [Tachysurus vachellii]